MVWPRGGQRSLAQPISTGTTTLDYQLTLNQTIVVDLVEPSGESGEGEDMIPYRPPRHDEAEMIRRWVRTIPTLPGQAMGC